MEPVSKMDQIIGNYIANHERNEFQDVLSEDERLEVAFYLSELPNGLLGWYPFEKSGKVLQIGSWFGAFTEMLCSRCRDVTIVEADPYRAYMTGIRLKEVNNLTIIQKSILDCYAESKIKYDYILFVIDENFDVFPDKDAYQQIISVAKAILDPEGKLLFCLPNRFGIKYFCGEPDPNTKVRFDGMTEDNSGLYRFDRQELLNFIEEAGFPYMKMYYPMPDHHHTQTLYSDDYRPDSSMKERLYNYVTHKTERILDEWPLIDRLTKNNVMHFFSNTFLVEAGNTPCSQVIYSAISAERARERAFATNIMADDTVEKVPLYAEGSKGIKQLINHTCTLSKRGIPVLKMEEKEGRAVMPYVKLPSFSSYLQETAKKDVDIFLDGLDRLRDHILRSSDHVSAEKNELLALAPEADWGVILKKAYLEMIPVNSFCDQGEILFYDQEFTKDNCPAGYVLFRALKDIYHFTPEINDQIPIENLKERYGLNTTWEYYAQEEERFQTELRRRNIYSGFFHWLRYLVDVVEKNRLKLNSGEGERDYFNPFSDLDSRRIILFGAGRIAEYYLEKYGPYYPTYFIVDNNQEKWGSQKDGIEIKDPVMISRLMPGTYRVIIVVKKYEPIVRQLADMGIGADSYRIFNTEIDLLLGKRLQVSMTDGKYEVGYVAGKFDQFGMQELRLLEHCKAKSHCLIVGVYTDEQIETEEDKIPPVPFKERMEIVRQCKYVDRVIPADPEYSNEIEMWKEIHFGCLFLQTDTKVPSDAIWLQRKLRTLGSEVEFLV